MTCFRCLAINFATDWTLRIPKGVWEGHAADSCRVLQMRGHSAGKLPGLIVHLPRGRPSSSQYRGRNERTPSHRRRAGVRDPHVHANPTSLYHNRSAYRAGTSACMTI